MQLLDNVLVKNFAGLKSKIRIIDTKNLLLDYPQML